MTQPPFILVDGSSYLFRAYHALPALTNSKGQATGAVYGVLNMIRKLIRDYQPEHMAVIFDTKGKTFRHEVYKEYKANRPEMPEELASQIKPLHEMIRAMGLPLLMMEGVEADDIIGTLAKQAEKDGLKTLISTGDKDMAQLVDDNITLINTMTNTVMNCDGVKEKFGVMPEQIIDYLALIGDKSDNVPGVPNVGPKTAVKWLEKYNNLDDIIAYSTEIGGKVGENLRENLTQLPLSRALVTIRLDIPLDETPQTLIPKAPDNELLIQWCKELEFKSWLSELLGEKKSEPFEKKYQTIFDKTALDQWIKHLDDAKHFAFDTETTSLNAMQAEVVGVSFSTAPGEAAYVPLAHDYEGAPQQLDKNTVLNALKPLLENPSKTVVGQNLKYDINVLARYDIQFKAALIDTMLESYVLDSGSRRHDMDTLALKYLGTKTVSFEEVAGKGVKQKTFNQVDIDSASSYASEDADVTLQLHQTLYPQIEQIDALKQVFSNIEMPLMPVLAEIERNGVLIDVKLLESLSQKFGSRINELQAEAYKVASEEFNLSSPKQLQEILFNKLNMPVIKKTAGGQPSTAEPILQELAFDYPLPKIILEYRSLSKLKSTYTDALPKQINSTTGRVHTSYNQAVTATGRLSSTEPNLQNIPVRNEEGRRIREAFIAPKGYKIVSSDYSQIELRIMAHLSQDAGLLKAFANGLDIHKATASEVFGVPIDQVSFEQRRSAKAINFGLIYGMSAFGLAKQIGVERGVAQEYMDLYFARYPGVKHYMENTRTLAAKQGYVETILGRRLYTPDINASNMMRRKAAERAAINAPMQGSAADIIKIAMIRMQRWLEKDEIDARMIMQVHDELVFEVAEKDVEKAKQHIQVCMIEAITFDVPLAVDIGVGDNWAAAH